MNRSMHKRGERGVSLIEALVALAVMAFGLLGVVGMQATLRFSSDISKQRSEAVRMAQEQVEAQRAFALLSGAPTGQLDYAGIASGGPSTVSVATGFANTSFERTTTVVNPGVNDPLMKQVTVRVGWLDRRTASGGVEQSVTLSTNITQVAPAMGASLGLPGDRAATQRPRGRNPAVPAGAVDQSGADAGKSVFTPPGGGGATFTFVNSTGQIINVCNPAGTCTATLGWLVSGYIHFINTGVQPTAALGETPTGAAVAGVSVSVNRTTPTAPAAPTCFTSNFSALTLVYYCLVPTDPTPTTWSGRANLTGLTLSGSLSDDTLSNRKVCRYTPSATDTPAGGNRAHPLDYVAVNESLTNQNFLVIGAGNGAGLAYDCPADLISVPNLLNTNTYRHQPLL